MFVYRCQDCKIVYRTVCYHRGMTSQGYRFRNVEVTEDVRDKARCVSNCFRCVDCGAALTGSQACNRCRVCRRVFRSACDVGRKRRLRVSE